MNLFEIMTGKLSRLSYVNRYSSFPVNRRENVAEHSFWVTFIAYVIALDLQEQGHRVSTEHVLRQAMMHDISEAVSGDIIRSYKHLNDEVYAAMKDADAAGTYELVRNRDFGATAKRVHEAWLYAKSDTTLEGQIVAFADMAAAAFYMREEDRSGNRAIREVMRQMYETWFAAYHGHHALGQYIDQMYPNGRFFDMMRETELPARRMFERPMMQDHREGPVSDAELDWHGGEEVPLG